MLAALALALLSVWVGGAAGCSLLLETDNPQACRTNADCARYFNAACDNAHRRCVPKLPYGSGDAGTDATADAGGSGSVCQLSFDNATRLLSVGPDGGFRPLPEVP